MSIKQKIYIHFLKMLNTNIPILQKSLVDLKESSSNETKSTAGDKYETALAMLQIEQSNAREQLQVVLTQKNLLDKINPTLSSSIIMNGSLIRTNKGYFFISIAMRKALIDGMVVYALSPQSPLGKKLMGLKIYNKVIVNNIEYYIESIE